MDWNRSNTLALARPGCAQCYGMGFRRLRGAEVPCSCVFRAIFRACYSRFRECVCRQERISSVNVDVCRGRDGRRTYARKNEEYIADFCLVSQRSLDADEYLVFNFHFLLGADWKLCCRRWNLQRGAFFHLLYHIEQKLGRRFADLEPYPLFPLDEYFGARIQKGFERATDPGLERWARDFRRSWRAPLRRSA